VIRLPIPFLPVAGDAKAVLTKNTTSASIKAEAARVA